MNKVKPCPICGIGNPRMVHYALPMKYFSDCWEETDDCYFEPVATYKRIECSNCGATSIALTLYCDGAIDMWNHETEDGIRDNIIQYVYDEEMKADNG